MIDAQVLIATGTAYSLDGPWMSRGGDYLQATLNVVAIGGSPTLKVEVRTKNSEDSGDGESSGSEDITATAVGVLSDTWRSGSGGGGTSNATLKELVRYRFTISGTSGAWVAFRMLPPVWFDAVQATS
ncbi:MAG: hypothetical protein AB7I19_17555 [Planctomycetota bacterium]